MQELDLAPEFVEVAGVRTELRQEGAGRPILFLHPGMGIGLDGSSAFVRRMSEVGGVLAPSHPGFGASELPSWMNSVDDLAYFYLDLLDKLDLRDVVLVGASLGGWIAAAVAVKSTARLCSVVLLDAFGIKISGRETRDIADVHALTRTELSRRLYANPTADTRDFASFSDDRLRAIARGRETEAFIAWSPYMYDPKLIHRLHRIDVPTLVLWGAADGIVAPDYGRAYASAIPNARFHLIDGAAHMPHIEQPIAVAALVASLAGFHQKSRVPA